MEPLTTSALITAGSSLLGGIFGNKSSKSNTKWQLQNAREDRKWNAEQAALARSEADKYQRNLMADQFNIMKTGALSAGIHPLAALGAAPAAGQGAVIPGQSNLGSIQKDDNFAREVLDSGIKGLSMAMAKAQLDNLNADTAEKLSNAARTSQPGLNTISANRPNPQGDFPPLDYSAPQAVKVEHNVEPPKIQMQNDDGNPLHREQNANQLRPMSLIHMGPNKIWIPVEEVDTFLEDPASVSAATMAYHGNKNVDWPMVAQYYYHGTAATPAQATEGTKRMFNRIKWQNKRKGRQTPEQFYPYSRGPHR